MFGERKEKQNEKGFFRCCCYYFTHLLIPLFLVGVWQGPCETDPGVNDQMNLMNIDKWVS